MVAARIYVVRHGETDENKQGVMQGHLDTRLNDTGIKQAHLAGQALKDIQFDIAFTSDLERASLVS